MLPVPIKIRISVAALIATASLAPCPPATAAPPSTAHHLLSSPAPAANAIDADLRAAIAAAPSAESWPNNNYARLLDIGDVIVKSDGTVVAKYRMTYKLFNERARDLAEVNLPYNSSYQSIRVLNARTIKKDGTVVSVAPADIRTSAQFSDYLMYDDAQGYGFSMPAIEDNCVIDYTWEEISRPLVMPGQFTNFWGFNGPEPVSESRYTLHVPASKQINFRVYNDPALKPAITLSPDGKTRIYVWDKRQMKPLDLEPSMPPYQEISTWMEVSSLGSWEDIAHWFWGLEAPQARPSPAIRTTVMQLVAGRSTDDDKARAIYDWVANHTRYVGLEFGLSAFKPHAAGEVHDKLYGDCKDKATLLVTMLALAGIKADPVLLHAGDRRKVDSDLPTLNAFNHCIALAKVNGKDVWLDATAEACSYGDIPYSDRGVEGLVVHDGSGVFETIPRFTGEENGLEVNSNIAVQPDGGANATMSVEMRGTLGQEMRARARSTTPDQRKQMMQGMAQRLSTGATLTTYRLPDIVEKKGPYVMSLATSAPNFGKHVGHLLLIPLSLGVGSSDRPNPYTQDTRTWPIVQQDAAVTKSTTVITLPEGFAVDDAPADIDLIGPLQEYHRKIVRGADGKTLTVTASVIDRTGSVPASDYKKVRQYYDQLLKYADDQLVLKQK